MTTADRKLIDEAIIKYGNGWWNKPIDDGGGGSTTNREGIILDLLNILEKDDLDLKVIRKK